MVDKLINCVLQENLKKKKKITSYLIFTNNYLSISLKLLQKIFAFLLQCSFQFEIMRQRCRVTFNKSVVVRSYRD